MGCCLNKNPGSVLVQEEKTDTGQKQTSASFVEAALDIKLVCLWNSSNAHWIPSELKSTSLQREKEKEHIIHRPKGVFSISRCATDRSHFHKDIFIYWLMRN